MFKMYRHIYFISTIPIPRLTCMQVIGGFQFEDGDCDADSAADDDCSDFDFVSLNLYINDIEIRLITQNCKSYLIMYV